jgi:hypothetical protein
MIRPCSCAAQVTPPVTAVRSMLPAVTRVQRTLAAGKQPCQSCVAKRPFSPLLAHRLLQTRHLRDSELPSQPHGWDRIPPACLTLSMMIYVRLWQRIEATVQCRRESMTCLYHHLHPTHLHQHTRTPTTIHSCPRYRHLVIQVAMLVPLQHSQMVPYPAARPPCLSQVLLLCLWTSGST